MRLIATFNYQGSGTYRSERQVEVSSIKTTHPESKTRYLYGNEVTLGKDRQFKQFNLALMDNLKIQAVPLPCGVSLADQLRQLAQRIEEEGL